MPAPRSFPAHDLKPGDGITFDFRGAPNRLGEVEVFDAYPCPGGVVQLVLTKAGRYYHRRVTASLVFEVR